jgi:hypothetical protein
MKTTIFVICLLCATAAFGQYGSSGGPAMTSTVQMTTHPAYALSQPMGQEHSLLEGTSVTSAHGEIPLWEAVPEKRTTPLGDVARMLKKEHAKDKKARKVYEN